MNRISHEFYTGCLLGGAAGDALGWPVEFESLDEIQALIGPAGVREMVPGKGGLYEITDGTQMTLPAEGLLRAWASARHLGSVPDFAAALKRSYLCWLATQEEQGRETFPDGTVGWLLSIAGLHERRAPGNTCLSALREMTLDRDGVPANDSKGCGWVMRAAPAGLLTARINDGDSANTTRLAFETGCQAAALPHGHPSEGKAVAHSCRVTG